LRPSLLQNFVPAHVHHFEDRSTSRGSAGQKSRSQGVPGETGGIESDARCMNLDDFAAGRYAGDVRSNKSKQCSDA
jgi:hypothetical protein